MATLQTLPEATTLLPAGAGPGTGNLAARSFLYAVFKHRALVIGVFAIVFIGSAVAAISRPRVYRATAKVLVKLGEAVQLAPSESPSRSYTQPLNPEIVNTESEIVRSREVVAESVRRLGITPEEGIDVDQLISGLQQGLTVGPTPQSNVLQISFAGRQPEKVAKFVNTVTDVFIERHNRVYRNEGMHSFYSQQLRHLAAEMKAAQHRLRDYLRRENIVDIDQEISLLQADVIEQEKSLRGHQAKLRGAIEKLGEIDVQLKETPAQVTYAEEYLANPSIMTFKSKLADLEVERNRLLQQYLPNDRHVRDKEEEIARLERRMGEEKGSILNKETVQANELHRELERIALTHRRTVAELQAREPGLAKRLESQKGRLEDLRDRRFMVLNLKQEVAQTANAYEMYRRRTNEARLTEAMTNQSLVNVAVVERAATPFGPTNGLLTPLFLGILGGIGLATAMAVGVEYLNRRLRFEEEVERYLELPVLAVIPDLETAPDLAHV